MHLFLLLLFLVLEGGRLDEELNFLSVVEEKSVIKGSVQRESGLGGGFQVIIIIVCWFFFNISLVSLISGLGTVSEQYFKTLLFSTLTGHYPSPARRRPEYIKSE